MGAYVYAKGSGMVQMHVDPDELEKFAKELDQFIQYGEELNKSIQIQFGHVRGTWNDVQTERFAEELAETLKLLTNYAESAKAQMPRLRKQIEASRAFLAER